MNSTQNSAIDLACKLSLFAFLRRRNDSNLHGQNLNLSKEFADYEKVDFWNICSNMTNYGLNSFEDMRKYFIIYPVWLGLGAVGNLLVIILFLQKWSGKNFNEMSSYHFIIIHLAIADLLVCVSLQTLAWKKLEYYGKFECLFLHVFGNWVSYRILLATCFNCIR